MGWIRFLNMVQAELNELNRGSLKLEDIYNSDIYVSKYEDLQKISPEQLLNHLNNFGIKEGRVFGYVFNAKYYANKYEDLKAAFGNNYKAVLNHFLTCGMKEGRIASADFNVKAYKNRYKDLSDNLKNDMQAYFRHYIIFGADEKRISK